MPATGKTSEFTPTTIPRFWRSIVEERKQLPALKVKRNGKKFNWTWSEYYEQCRAFAKSLEKLGVDQRKAVNIMGFNSPEWVIALFGAIFHNNVVSGVYITNTDQACLYQAEHSEAQVIVVDTLEQLKLWMSIINKLPEVKAVVAWGIDKVPEEFQRDARVYTWKNFLTIGQKVKDEVIEETMDKQRPGNCCLLIYTSGTTGNPKGVMLSHDNILYNASIAMDDLMQSIPPDYIPADYESRVVSYLPLSHIAGFQFDVIHTLIFGSVVYFAKPDALQGTLIETLQWCKPTFFLAVPRIWEKFEEKLKEVGSKSPGFLQSISSWAKSHATQKVQQQAKGDLEFSTMFKLANFTILRRIKTALGLDEAVLFFYGAAPLKMSSVEYFASLDIPLNNVYGLSETTGGLTTHKQTDFRLDCAGEALSGTHIRIADPDSTGQGEITIAGRLIMMGYLKNEEATKECIDKDGYFKSGDLGRLEQGRFLKITGRIKELIIGAGGENIAPVPIEEKFKTICGACSNIMMVGEQRRFMSALITFKVEIDMSNGQPTKQLTSEAVAFLQKEAGVSVKTSDEACANPKVVECIQKFINETNKTVVSRAAQIKKFALVPVDFSIPGGELTPTMKLKRKVTEQKYKELVEQMYAMEAKM